MMTELKLSMVENAFDFLDEALLRLEDAVNRPNSTKYAILHLSSAVELIFKQKLYDIQWELIFQNLNKADKTKLESGDFQSVNLHKCFERLKDNGIILDMDDYQLLKSEFKLMRNKIEHYKVHVELDDAISITVKVWSIIVDFISNHIDLQKYDLEEIYEDIRLRLSDHEKYVKNRLDSIQIALQRESILINCPFCYQKALPLNTQIAECLFCRHVLDTHEYEEWIEDSEWWKHMLSEMSWDILGIECPSCELTESMNSTVNFKFIKTDLVCTNCGVTSDRADYNECTACGVWYQDNEMDVCDNCWDRKINS